MRHALALVLLVACAAHETPAPNPIARPSPSATVAAPSASVAAPNVPRTTRDRITEFASSRGGLHGEPVRMPYRTAKLKGAECVLFFVGGAAAHAAWLATPWDEAWGKASERLPNVSAEMQSPVLVDGVVFERVGHFPRAMRVLSATPNATGVVVNVETLASRDQPAGARGQVLIEDQPTSGSMPEATPTWTEHPELLTGVAASAVPQRFADKVLRDASASPPANVDAFEVWQGAFIRHAHPSAAAIKDALAVAAKAGCTREGVCVDESERVAPRGALVVSDGKTFRLGAVVVAPDAAPVSEPAPSPVAPDDALVWFRANQTPTGTPRAITSVAMGDAHGLVVFDDRFGYWVEHEGAYSRVTQIFYQRFEKSSVEARLDDVDGDGVRDVVFFARWPKQDDKDPYEAHTQAFVVYRTRHVGTEPFRTKLGVDLDLAGSRDLDDAVKRAHAVVAGATATKNEACALLAAASTPTGVVKNSVPSARIVDFDEPMDPSHAARITPVSRAKADDLATLKEMCANPNDGGFMCRDGLCGNLDYGLGSFARFSRERGALKLETAFVYTGS